MLENSKELLIFQAEEVKVFEPSIVILLGLRELLQFLGTITRVISRRDHLQIAAIRSLKQLGKWKQAVNVLLHWRDFLDDRPIPLLHVS